MSDDIKLSLINELLGGYYEGSYNSQEACEMLIDNIYTIIVFDGDEN